MTGWWFLATPLNNMISSIGMMKATQYSWENKIDGNQTTNQKYVASYPSCWIHEPTWLSG